jgi:hypothetical protein
MVSIEFEFDTPYGTFRDALVLPADHGLTDAELEAMKQQRLDNWVTAVTYTDPTLSADPPTE